MWTLPSPQAFIVVGFDEELSHPCSNYKSPDYRSDFHAWSREPKVEPIFPLQIVT